MNQKKMTLAISTVLGISGGSLFPGIVNAQQEVMLEEVIVTGSRIQRNPESYLGGMSIASGEDIEKIGSYSTLDLLNRLPAISGSSSGATSRNNANGGRGANFAEIHNLAPERTLVLVDGRRMVSTIRDSSGLAVDLQSFPPNMIDRIEVLADGASAVYGSDAVAGVINVILKTGFEGFELTTGAGTPQEEGGESVNLGFLYGAQSNNGHFVVSGTYTDTENVDYQDREWAQIPILGQLSDGAGGRLTLLGSGIPPEGFVPAAGIIFKQDPGGASFQPYDTFGTSGLNGSAGDGSIQSILDTGHRFNYNDIGGDGVSLIAPAKLFNFGAVGEVELGDGWTAYTNILAQHREGTLFFTPLPVSGAAGRFTNLVQVPFDNPNLPADAAAAIRTAVGPDVDTFQMFYRGSDLGNRKFEYDSDTIQGIFGFKNDLEFVGKEWRVDTYGTWGQSRLSEVTFGQLNVANLQTAVNPLACSLQSNCPKKANGDPLFDPFGRGPKTQAEKDFINFDDHEKTEYQMMQLAAHLSTGEMFDLPAGSVGFATGLEWRDESGSVTPSGVVGDGDSGGNFAEPTSGGYNLWEWYMELDVPLLSDLPMVEELSAELAARYSDYDDYSETTWKVGARWDVIESLSLRGQVSTGFRAPNVLELFGGNADSFTGVTDPCNAANQAANAVVAANCASQGVPANFVQPAAQLKITQGGNPNLEPETSDNFSVGVVVTPDIWGEPRITVDYYSVEVDGAISTPVPSNVINTCYETPNLAAPECDRIARGPAGDVVRFDLLNENLATIETSGVDVNATFAWDTSFGVITTNWLLNYLEDYTETTDTGVETDFTGKVACDVCSFAGYPEFKSNLSVALSQDNWSTSLTWRYLDEMEVSDEIGVDEFTTSTDAMNYLDFYGSYNWNQFQLSLGVENMTNEEPPFVPSISANTSPIFDFLGRFYSVRLKYSM